MTQSPRTAGDVQIMLVRTDPRFDPPIHLKVEYWLDVDDLDALKREIEEIMHDKFNFKAMSIFCHLRRCNTMR